MSDAYRVTLRSVEGGPTALISGGSVTVVADRPSAGGGRGLGFNGGQLLYASIAACLSNDLYREAATLGITLSRVAMTVDGDFPTRATPSSPIDVDIEVEGDAPVARLAELVRLVDEIAEIPNSIRGTTPVTIRSSRLIGSDGETTDTGGDR